ncbi:uncharacterized protein EDB91DRAFT_1255414 [Suillus paluster]|uniref:uncharacterized protein n=1 Tax=Suillus paluster TaxID=48578 RepID=UPI001B878792|nr:uncharacterized protein EDB91DRAFT_1255414 [Suillus paluster]KAG1724042.1 hypothetical protein EDB91DRAFT_1255414 [Suillus paluster]
MDLYPSDGTLPGLQDRVIEDHELNAWAVFATETDGFSTHPTNLMHGIDVPPMVSDTCDPVLVLMEKMGVSDPECDKMSGQAFTASALHNLLPNTHSPTLPDLVLHHTESVVPEYHNTLLFPGIYPTLFPYGIGGFEDSEHVPPLAFERQAKYFLNIGDWRFQYHKTFMFVIFNMLQR